MPLNSISLANQFDNPPNEQGIVYPFEIDLSLPFQAGHTVEVRFELAIKLPLKIPFEKLAFFLEVQKRFLLPSVPAPLVSLDLPSAVHHHLVAEPLASRLVRKKSKRYPSRPVGRIELDDPLAMGVGDVVHLLIGTLLDDRAMLFKRIAYLQDILRVFFISFQRDTYLGELSLDFDQRPILGLDLNHQARLWVKHLAIDHAAIFKLDNVGQQRRTPQPKKYRRDKYQAHALEAHAPKTRAPKTRAPKTRAPKTRAPEAQITNPKANVRRSNRLPLGYRTSHRKIHRNRSIAINEANPNRILRGFIVPIQGSNPRESTITVIISRLPRCVTFSPTPATKPCESPFCLRICSFRASR